MPRLFTIDTETVSITWSRQREKVPPVAPEEAMRPFGLVVQALRAGTTPAVHVYGRDAMHLFEQTDYALFVQSKTSAAVFVRHRDPVLVQGLQRTDDGRAVHGMVNFGAQVGRSRFVVEVDGAPQVAFEVEVYPSKLDYRRDYEALREDVQAIASELVMAYLRATYRPAGHHAADRSGRMGWLVLLHDVMDDLEQALGYVARRPYRETQPVVEARRADTIGRPDAALRRVIRRGGGSGSWQHTDGGVPVRERLPGAGGRYTLDTPAHRWLSARLALIHHRLADLYEAETRRRAGLRSRQVLAELAALQHRVVRLSRLAVMREAEGEPPLQPPLRLLTAPGYREAYRACLYIQQSLHLEGGPLHLGLKDLHLLYEYWCFLTLVRLAAEATGCRDPLHTLVAVEQHGLRLRLRKGRAQTVTFPLEAGRRLDLVYNPLFGGRRYLVPQQPDLLMTLHPASGPAIRYVLDAKYRLDASPSYRQRYGMPGPPADALNDLHRYRDAIQAPDASSQGAAVRVVRQAVALFPYRAETPGMFEQSRHCRMLDEIGVGAIPLLPGATDHLRRWLSEILQDGFQNVESRS